MTELLDNQVAARMTAECRDARELDRFQRAAYIVETLLEGLGFNETMKELRRHRMALGPIDRHAATPLLAVPEPGVDVLTGKRTRRKTATATEGA